MNNKTCPDWRGRLTFWPAFRQRGIYSFSSDKELLSLR